MSCKLEIHPCDYKAAKFAVLNFHYSQVMPAGKLVKYGVWEDKKFIGAVIFGRGANNNLAKSVGLTQTECCELVRVALSKHKTPVTRIISICLKLLKKSNKGLKVVCSYADKTNQGHEGVIYKAGNWQYHGIRSTKSVHTKVGDRLIHNRSISSKYKTRKNIPDKIKKILKKVELQEKHFFTYHLR